MHPNAVRQVLFRAAEPALGPDRPWSERVPATWFGPFVEACERARTTQAVWRLLESSARACGVDRIALVTHGRAEELGSFGVFAHNWGQAAITHLYAGCADAANPLFERTERSEDAIFWDEPAFRAELDARQVLWLERLAALGLKNGVSQRVRTAMIPASCSLTPARGELDPSSLRGVMRMAAHAFHTMTALQRLPQTEADLLTVREHQCLALAIFSGLRPREVAAELGVSINTVRSMRQSASARLGARSQEETVWRMVETGQLFHRGRTGRPRR